MTRFRQKKAPHAGARLFPGVPDAWKDVTIDKLRTEGAFLVSANRRGGNRAQPLPDAQDAEFCD